MKIATTDRWPYQCYSTSAQLVTHQTRQYIFTYIALSSLTYTYAMGTRCNTYTFCGHTNYVIRLVTCPVISKYALRKIVVLSRFMFTISDIFVIKAR